MIVVLGCCGGKVSSSWEKRSPLKGTKHVSSVKLKKKAGDFCMYCDGIFEFKVKKNVRGGWRKVLACSKCLLEVSS